MRTEDAVARWGGEEFLVLTPHTDAQGAHALGERLRAADARLSASKSGGRDRVEVVELA